MLNIHLVREVPEALKPKKIEIRNFDGFGNGNAIENDSE